MLVSASTKGRSCTFLHYLVTYDFKNQLGIKLRTKKHWVRNSTKARDPLWFLWIPSHSKIPCSTSAWESSETRSDIAQSSPADRQFSYWPIGLWLSQESASPSGSAARSASGKPANSSASAFLWNFGGLFRKNLVCEERASWDKRPNFLDWLFWYDLAIGRKKRKKNQVKMTDGATGKVFFYKF